jgi:uncharacterized protein YcbK (DUF882 family)
LGALLSGAAVSPLAPEVAEPKASVVLANKKDASDLGEASPAAEGMNDLATLVNLHSSEELVLDAQEPSQERFSAFVADRVTNSKAQMAPELLAMLRRVLGERDKSRVEIVSGYRSWKFNEILRKKGHKVASHSEHSRGEALDFRIVGVEVESLRKQVEQMKWQGGLGYYPGATDRFIHVDIGKKRRWRGK